MQNLTFKMSSNALDPVLVTKVQCCIGFWEIHDRVNQRTGLEIKFSVQWTAGPPVLKIWWSGFDAGGPMKF